MTDVELTISAGQKEPGTFRLIFTLAFAAALSGLVLASTYQVTKPIIDANNAEALRKAVFEVVPGSTLMQKLELKDGGFVPMPDDATATAETIYGAYDEHGRFIGYAIAGAGPGFQDTIRLLYGYDPRTQRVVGMYVLESRETPGLGDKIWKDEAFVQAFRALTVDPPIVVVKDGADAENEVDAITGATISAKAIVKIINTGNTKWLGKLPPSGQELPLQVQPEPAAPDSKEDATSEEGS